MAGKKVTPGVLASFEHIDSAVEAIHGLKRSGHDDLTVYSAAPNHELEEALVTGSSWVRAFTLFGALTGCAAGYAMTTKAGIATIGLPPTRTGQLRFIQICIENAAVVPVSPPISVKSRTGLTLCPQASSSSWLGCE